jgi:membrane-bound ClpP family serine protease
MPPRGHRDARQEGTNMATLLLILGIILIVAGVVNIVRGGLLWGIVMVVVGIIIAPGSQIM